MGITWIAWRLLAPYNWQVITVFFAKWTNLNLFCLTCHAFLNCCLIHRITDHDGHSSELLQFWLRLLWKISRASNTWTHCAQQSVEMRYSLHGISLQSNWNPWVVDWCYLSPGEDMYWCSEGGQLLDDLESNAISSSSNENRRFTEILGRHHGYRSWSGQGNAET